MMTDMDRFKECLDKLDPDSIVCVASTSSCFAPRTCDDLVGIAKECQTRNIPHVCNNAYGLQSTRCCHLINEAIRVGRLDAFVQSTDKNFQVPVGGAVVSSSSRSFVEEVGKSYISLSISILDFEKVNLLKPTTLPHTDTRDELPCHHF